jgi:NADPH:quinone reductase-like Zn-dependent oxidoreductase
MRAGRRITCDPLLRETGQFRPTINTEGVNASFLARVASDGTAGYYTVFPAGLSETVAVDANGNVTLFGASSGISGVVQRIDSSGAATLETTLAGAAVAFSLDAAGNAYVAAVTNQLNPRGGKVVLIRHDLSRGVSVKFRLHHGRAIRLYRTRTSPRRARTLAEFRGRSAAS